MINFIFDLGRSNPQIVIFLAIAIGYFVGKIKVFGFNLGSTAGVLLTALVIGQIGVEVPTLVRTIAFAFFIFAIGYKVGPQFFGALKKEGLNYIWISLVVAVTGLVTAIVLGKIFGFGPGITAGLLSGAMTQSSVIGTADGAISHLAVSSAVKATYQSNVAVAYAITYIFGTAGLVIFFKILPRILKIDLKSQAKQLEVEMTGKDELSPELFSWYKRLNLRAYRVTNSKLAGKKVSEAEAMFPDKVAIEKVKHGNQVIDAQPETLIQSGDIIALVGPRDAFLNADQLVGPEVDDKSVEDIIGEIMDVCVLKPGAVGKTLGEISQKFGYGCYLRKIERTGQNIPLTRNTIVKKCDVLTIVGAKKDVDKFVNSIGYAERPTNITDLTMVGWACTLGTLLGLIAIPLFGIPITLGVGGGVLVAGLVFGWLRAVHPTFGQIPGGVQWVFTDLGLNLFIACVGLSAGPRAVSALQATGPSIFIAGVILTMVPIIVGLIFGRVVLKLTPVLLYGALTGAQTCTAALNSVKEDADSALPALGYTVPYAFGNVILTIWGTVLVYVMR